MPTTIPVTTLSNFRQNLVPPSLLDLLYMQQGSEHDRDSAITLGGLLESQVFQSFLNDRDNWRTFTIDENNSITLGDYQRNVIIVPSAKDQSVTLDHFPSNGLIIYAPDWDSESASTAVTIGDSNGARPIIKDGVGVFYCFGSSLPIISKSLISSGNDSLAQLKQLYVDKLIVESDLTLPDSSILSEYIANRAVTNSKIALAAVHEENIDPGAVTAGKLATGAVTTDKISTNAVETDNIKDKAVDSSKLADHMSFVNRPTLPPNVLAMRRVESDDDYGIITSSDGVFYKGIIFSTEDNIPLPGWGIKLHITDADLDVANNTIYRIYNNTPNDADVNDYATGTFYTRILAWSFKDFYYLDGWRMD